VAAVSGLAWTTLDVDNAAGAAKGLRNNITGLDVAMPRGVQDITGLDKSAFERLLLLADFSGTMAGVFDSATDQAHDVFKTIPSTSALRTITMVVDGQTLANECYLTDYVITRASSGELTFSVPFTLGDGTVPTWS